MPDISHLYGSDLTVSSSGDVQLSSGTQLGEEKILRRLIMSPGDDINHLEEGAGLARALGSPTNENNLKAIIYAQMREETVVSQVDPVNVTVANYGNGQVSVLVQYVDAVSGATATLEIPYTSPNVVTSF